MINERCTALLLNKLPSKEKDPGSFTIPYQVSNLRIDNALADLGASISLMPYTMYERLGLGEPKPTRMSLELVDRSIQYPKWIVENVLIKVDKFVLPIDFVIQDMPENPRIPIILGRPFLATARAMIDVFDKKITLKVGDDEVIFDMDQFMKNQSSEDEECYDIDDLDDTISNETLELLESDHSDCFLVNDLEKGRDQRDLEKCDCFDSELVNESDLLIRHISSPNTVYQKHELKDLPSHLEYAYLYDNESFPLIISSKLSIKEKKSFLQVLKKHKGEIAWKMSDIIGISPSFYTHKILMEEDFKLVIQTQRRLNPKVQDVVKNEIIKLIDFGLIYPISDSPWVSPIHVVPKKGGMTIVLNDNNELIPSRIVTGWRVCIDYRKLNDTTKKDHFPLSFINQMLDRLSGNEYYCFLDGFSGFFQITIALEDQDKTIFTCPYGTFAYRMMPFGLCNAPATFERCMTAIFHDMVEDSMEVFMDNFSVFGNSFDYFLANFDRMLARCKETNLVLNWEKCHFMVKEGIVLGHKISGSGIEVDKAKIDVISKIPYPTNVKGVRSFLGYGGFYRRAFNILKEKLSTVPLIISPDWNIPFKLMCDASDYAGFSIDIKDKKGAKNLAADHLSRLENPNIEVLSEGEIDDEFLEEHLMMLKAKVNNAEP
ncbi:putative nucleotidyltransferase, ribonuclease H, partial [Tanacetum coccineum]